MPIGSRTVLNTLRTTVSLGHEVHSYRRFLTSRFRGLRETGAPVDVHPEVDEALAHNKPVVALESTIITHGMPYPTSIDMAQSVENIVRSTGCIPATIGILEGRVKIGLEARQLERLASRCANPLKISRRDIGAAIVSGNDGGTTCSSTLIFAALAGIKVFATGGLGGVHRGGENTMDVSADLYELARCPVGLVSAGVKSILDIGRTLEYLETLGVPVVSYGETKDFPAFYSRKSGYQAPWNVTNATDAARILCTHSQFGMTNGALFAVPIPESYEAAGAAIQEAVELAVRESEESGISKLGKEVTPWLLKRVGELTQGRSLESNIALVRNTALIGGQIAREYANLSREDGQIEVPRYPGFQPSPHSTQSCARDACGATGEMYIEPSAVSNDRKVSIVVVGCAAVDITSKVQQTPTFSQKTTHPGKLCLTLGGVARNIAEAAHRVLTGSRVQDSTTLLIAPIGEDIFGNFITDSTRSMGMRTDGLSLIPGRHSAVCNVVLDAQGGLETGIADMGLPQLWKGSEVFPVLREHRPQFLVLDGNISSETLTAIVTEAAISNVQVFFEPTSVPKSTRIFPAVAANLGRTPRSVISYTSPNLLELGHMYEEARTAFDLMSQDHWWRVIDRFSLGSSFRTELGQLAKARVSDEAPELGDLSFLVNKGIIQMAINLLPFFQHLVIKCGELGVVVVMRLGDTNVVKRSMERSNPQSRYIVHSSASAETIVVQHFPPIHVPPGTVVNTTGAGDTLVGALLALLVQNPNAFLNVTTLSSIIDVAQRAAVLTLQSSCAVSPLLSSLPMQPL